VDVTGCLNCKLPPQGEGPKPFLLPDNWGWTDDGIVCPTCVRLGVPVDTVAGPGN